MKTRLPRSSFHHAVVTFFGSRRSISRANASAALRHHRELPLGLDAAEDVHAAIPRGLRPADVADLGEHLAHERSDALGVLERRARLRVDVDAELVRVLRVLTARRPGMEVDDREVGGPDDLGELRHAELVRMPARGERHARRLDPLRTLFRHPLLVDLLALDAVGETPQLGRPLVQRAHDAVPDRDVVVDEVALRLLRLREEHLVRVRHLDDPLPHLELDEWAKPCAARSSGATLAAPFPD